MKGKKLLLICAVAVVAVIAIVSTVLLVDGEWHFVCGDGIDDWFYNVSITLYDSKGDYIDSAWDDMLIAELEADKTYTVKISNVSWLWWSNIPLHFYWEPIAE